MYVFLSSHPRLRKLIHALLEQVSEESRSRSNGRSPCAHVVLCPVVRPFSSFPSMLSVQSRRLPFSTSSLSLRRADALNQVNSFHLVLNVRAVARSPPPNNSHDRPITLDEILVATCMASTARNVFRANVVAVEVVSERISEDGEEPMTETNRRSTRSEPHTQGYWDRVHAWDSDAERARKTSSGVTRQTL